MPRSKWGILAALAGLAALFIALGLGAFFGALSAPYYGYQTRHTAELTAGGKQDIPGQIDRNRAGLPYIAERIISGSDPTDSDEKDRRDLAAQESMSVWAFWMLITSAVGVATTMLGTGFLLWQIILTREAVRDTAKATEAMERQNRLVAQAQRPWLSFEAEVRAVHKAEPPTLLMSLVVKNHSEFPAHQVRGMAVGRYISNGIRDMVQTTIDKPELISQLEGYSLVTDSRSVFPQDTNILYPVVVRIYDPNRVTEYLPEAAVRITAGVAYDFDGGTGITTMQLNLDNLSFALEGDDDSSAGYLGNGGARARRTILRPVPGSIIAS